MTRRILLSLALALTAANTTWAHVDLRIEDPWIYSPRQESGRVARATLFFRVVNGGITATTITFRTRIDVAGTSRVVQTPGLTAGERAYVSHTIPVPATGSLTFSIAADIDSVIAESDEANNTASRSLDLNLPALGQWLSIGPRRIDDGAGHAATGIVTALAVDPQNANVIYAGGKTASGGKNTGSGIWKTTDGGNNWQPIAHNLDSLEALSVAVAPSQPSRVYLATAAAIYRSEDSGTSWKRVSNQSGGKPLIVHPTNAQKLYMPAGNSILRSTDGGANWTALPVAAASPGGDWTEAGDLDLVRDAAGVLWAGVGHGTDNAVAGVYRSADDGASWTRYTGCYTLSAMAGRRVRLARSGGTLYVGLHSDTYDLFRTDPGVSCSIGGRIEQPMTRTAWVPEKGNSQWGWLFADPSDERVVYVTGGYFSFSSDRGDSFTRVQGGHVDHHAFAFHPTNPAILYAGNDGGLFRSVDRGATWTFIADGLRNVFFYDGGMMPGGAAGMIGGTQDNGGAIFNGSSQAWAQFVDGDVERVATHPTDSSLFYTAGQKPNQVGRVALGGPPFCVGCGLPVGDFDFGLMVDPLDPRRVLMARGDFFRSHADATCAACPSEDRPAGEGNAWDGYPVDGSDSVRRVAVDTTASLYYAGDADGVVSFALAPGLDAWGALYDGSGAVKDIEVDPADPTIVYVAFSGAGPGRLVRLLRSAPAPGMTASGVEMAGTLPAGLRVTSLAVDRLLPNTVYAATQNGVWRGVLTQNGWTWSAYSNGMPPLTNVREVEVVPQTAVLRATTWGGGAFEAYPARRYHTLSVTKQSLDGAATGVVTSSPAGISCGGDCSESYLLGTSVRLEAATASVFRGWSGCDVVSGSTCFVTMSADRGVSARFACGLPSCFETCIEACMAEGFTYGECVPGCNARCGLCE